MFVVFEGNKAVDHLFLSCSFIHKTWAILKYIFKLKYLLDTFFELWGHGGLCALERRTGKFGILGSLPSVGSYGEYIIIEFLMHVMFLILSCSIVSSFSLLSVLFSCQVLRARADRIIWFQAHRMKTLLELMRWTLDDEDDVDYENEDLRV